MAAQSLINRVIDFNSITNNNLSILLPGLEDVDGELKSTARSIKDNVEDST